MTSTQLNIFPLACRISWRWDLFSYNRRVIVVWRFFILSLYRGFLLRSAESTKLKCSTRIILLFGKCDSAGFLDWYRAHVLSNESVCVRTSQWCAWFCTSCISQLYSLKASTSSQTWQRDSSQELFLNWLKFGKNYFTGFSTYTLIDLRSQITAKIDVNYVLEQEFEFFLCISM